MAELTTKQYDALERAIVRGTRIAVFRRGGEFVVVPKRLRSERGRETLECKHPTTGDKLVFYLDELEAIEVVQ